MALTNQPYLPLYVQDWLSNNKLKLCTPGAHGLMINIMCLLHKSDEYGTILLQQKFKQSDKQIINFATMIARLLPFEFTEVHSYLTELIDEEILKISGEKLFCERMVKDAELSLKRSLVGSKGGKTTSKNNKNFAVAKVQANSEYEIENEIVIDNDIKKEKVKRSKQKEEELNFPYTSELFMSKWEMFISMPKQKNKLQVSKQIMLNKLSEFDEEFSINQLDLAIANNWQGLTFSDTKQKFQDYVNKKGSTKQQNQIGKGEHILTEYEKTQERLRLKYQNEQQSTY